MIFQRSPEKFDGHSSWKRYTILFHCRKRKTADGRRLLSASKKRRLIGNTTHSWYLETYMIVITCTFFTMVLYFWQERWTTVQIRWIVKTSTTSTNTGMNCLNCIQRAKWCLATTMTGGTPSSPENVAGWRRMNWEFMKVVTKQTLRSWRLAFVEKKKKKGEEVF